MNRQEASRTRGYAIRLLRGQTIILAASLGTASGTIIRAAPGPLLAGTSRQRLEGGIELFGTPPGDSQIETVGADLDVIAPCHRSHRTDTDGFEDARLVPAGENALPGEIGEIHLAFHAIGE